MARPPRPSDAVRMPRGVDISFRRMCEHDPIAQRRMAFAKRFVFRQHVRQAGGVREQVADCHRGAVGAFEFGYEFDHGIVKFQMPAIGKQHDDCGGHGVCNGGDSGSLAFAVAGSPLRRFWSGSPVGHLSSKFWRISHNSNRMTSLPCTPTPLNWRRGTKSQEDETPVLRKPFAEAGSTIAGLIP